MEDRLDHRPGIGSHALVIGGSMAGLLAARVLSTHFDGVTVVERDRFPEEPAPRKGVPQASHQHLMLKRGADILERLFPGIRGELVAAGAPLVDMANDAAWLTPFGWGVRFLSELIMLTGSRDFLEWVSGGGWSLSRTFASWRAPRSRASCRTQAAQIA